MARPPTQELTGSRDVELIMIIRHLDHERANERLFAAIERIGNDRLERSLYRNTGFGGGLGNSQGAPLAFAVNELAQLILAIALPLTFANRARRRNFFARAAFVHARERPIRGF